MFFCEYESTFFNTFRIFANNLITNNIITTMKKNLFTLVLMLTALNAGAQDLEYSFDNATRTAKVTYRMRQLGDGTWERIQGGYHGDIVIPEEVSGYTVTGVGELAFDQCYDVTSVKFPNTMKSIEERAFYG